jgi:putative ABC transport system ATP-binding protein
MNNCLPDPSELASPGCVLVGSRSSATRRLLRPCQARSSNVSTAPLFIDEPLASRGVFTDVGGPVVRGRDLEKRYGDGATAVHALRGVSIEVAGGTFTAVMGPSGSGKSTLMHLLAGLDQPSGGEVWLGPTKLNELDDTELTRLRRKRVGFVFQTFNLLPALTLEENVVLPLRIAGEGIDHEWVEQLLTAVGLQDRRKHRPAELSGGEQQRVALARALVTRPAIVFADEPTGNLDSQATEVLLHIFRRAVENIGQTIMLVTHDALAASRADRIVFLSDGRVVQETGQLSAAEVVEAVAASR